MFSCNSLTEAEADGGLLICFFIQSAAILSQSTVEDSTSFITGFRARELDNLSLWNQETLQATPILCL